MYFRQWPAATSAAVTWLPTYPAPPLRPLIPHPCVERLKSQE